MRTERIRRNVMLLSRKALQRMLGALWLIDGLFQLQPRVFTMDMINGVMAPMVHRQPAPIGTNLQWIVDETVLHLTLINLPIAIIQISFGLGFLVLSDRWVKAVVWVSIVWSVIIWYAGEGMDMLFIGLSSVLSGAPSAVLFYLFLGLVVYPRQNFGTFTEEKADAGSLFSCFHLRCFLSGFWCFAALLQLQSYWWQPSQVRSPKRLAVWSAWVDWTECWLIPSCNDFLDGIIPIEIPLNSVFIILFLALGLALAMVKDEQMHFVLMASIMVSVVIWYVAQADGGFSEEALNSYSKEFFNRLRS